MSTEGPVTKVITNKDCPLVSKSLSSGETQIRNRLKPKHSARSQMTKSSFQASQPSSKKVTET